MSVTTTTTTAPSRIVIKPGECAILPSNAIILSTFTFDDAPDVQSDDCPELALDIFSKLEIAQEYCVRMAETSRLSSLSSNYEDVWIQGIRVNDVEYPFTVIPNANGINIQLYSTPSSTPANVLIYQKAIDSTALAGSIKIISVNDSPPHPDDDSRGWQVRIKLKTFPAIQKDFTFYGFGGSTIPNQEGGVKIEFRVLNCDDVAVNQ
jgi:hypothetical protein